MDTLGTLFLMLRYVSVASQHLHWTVTGPEAFSDHKLLDAIYKLADEKFDLVAERLVGLGDASMLDTRVQAVYLVHEAQQNPVGDLTALLRVVREISGYANDIIVLGGLPEGTVNLVAEIADEFDQQTYFLQQRLR